MARLFVLDAMGLAYRAYYAFIRRPLINSRGENTSAIFGLANTALKIRREEKPDFWALAWDGPGPTFRHERFPDYKATRKPMPADLLAQIPALEDLAAALGLPVLEIPGAEADDVMATLAVRGAGAGHEVALVTSDKDMVQLVGERVRLLSPSAREDFVWVDRAAVREKWGVDPGQVRDVLALMGDTSDNVPGVPGVGEKTAAELIREFGSLEALYRRLGEVKRDSLRASLEAHREQADLSRELVTVKTDLDLPWTIEDLRVGAIRRDLLLELAKRYEIVRLRSVAEQMGVGEEAAGAPPPRRSMERRGTAAETPAPGVKLAGPAPTPASAPAAAPARAPTPAAAPAPAPAPPPLAPTPGPSSAPVSGAAVQVALDLWSGAAMPEQARADLEALTASLHEVRARSVHGLALLPVLEEGDSPRGAPVGLALAARDGTASYLPLRHEGGPNFDPGRLRDWLGPSLADPASPKVAHDLKACLHALHRLGWTLAGLDFDLHLGSFVCDPMRDHSLDGLARDFLGETLPPLAPPPARGRPRTPLTARPAREVAAAAALRAQRLFPLADALRGQIQSREQTPLYERIEHPLIVVLFEMEREGVLLDRAVLRELAVRAGEEIERLRRELLVLAGEEINLESGPQVAKVLFETLKLKPGGKTPGGALSTRSDVLEDLAAAHPFPARLLEYRVLAKLKSTYLDSLPLAADPRDGRVRTTFEQAGAATGRLASSDPNLQNIPMRTPQGRAIRHAFVASPGSVLVGADYSQIELRLMAHLSGDPQLLSAFQSGEDVHESTARRIFNVTGPLDPALRARAKVVNFGIIYGMGARSLSSQMGIGLDEAQEFIAHYFRVYAGVREYLDRMVTDARRRGFVETLLGRRRYLPGLASPHGAERSLAERAAINTPIQGSAADLMKLAMIRVRGALKPLHPSARLLLQVHDELLLECPAGEASAVSERVRAEMEGCFALNVPLRVTVGRGPSWFDVH
ncbi:MAG TPA: DNA polymerase I [Candidatus Eisenbacteria bacterium]|jgi:DNA polymerase-1